MKREYPTIPAGEFKAKCLALLDRVNRTGEPVVVTKRGKPVAQLVAAEAPKKWTSLRGTGVVLGDLLSPPNWKWEMDR